MGRKTIRASLLLKSVTCIVSLVIFFAVLKLATLGPITMFVVVALIVFWFVGLEAGLLPAYLQRIAENHASKSGGTVGSIWFVDSAAEREQERRDFGKKTEDNPTLR